ELNDAASSTASQTINIAASGVKVTCSVSPPPGENEIRLRAKSMDPIDAIAAARLMAATASVLPTRTWLLDAGVRSRLSSVLRSRSPAELSRAAERPPVRLMVIRMYGRKKLKNELPAAFVGELSGWPLRGRGSRILGSMPFSFSVAAILAAS